MCNLMISDDAVGFPLPAPFDVIPQALGEDLGEMSSCNIGNTAGENQGPIHDPNDTVPVVVPRQDGSVEEIPQALKDFLDQMRMKQMGKKKESEKLSKAKMSKAKREIRKASKGVAESFETPEAEDYDLDKVLEFLGETGDGEDEAKESEDKKKAKAKKQKKPKKKAKKDANGNVDENMND